MSRVRTKYERATAILSNCLSDVQQVPCFSAEDVKTLSDAIDILNKSRGKLEQSYRTKIKGDW